MNIGFDAKRYFHNRTGLGNYSRDLVDTLITEFPDNAYFLFDNSSSGTQLPAHVKSISPDGNKLLWRVAGVLKDIREHQLDVFHGLSNELPWGKWPEQTQKVVTIHDVIFRVFPKQYAAFDRWIYHRKTAHAVNIADKIIATSQATAKDLVKFYRADEKKLHVVYQTCGQAHWKMYAESELQAFRDKYGLQFSFILYVSSFQARKNHISLLKALRRLNDPEAVLVFAGKAKETYQDAVKFVKEHQLDKQVIFLTDIQNEELPLLYRCAQSFVYPSLLEGFGIPLIEAACAALPIAVNDIEVFREIAPPGTLFFDAGSPEKMAETMKALMQMPKKDYTTHLQSFTPSFAASNMLEIYKLDK